MTACGVADVVGFTTQHMPRRIASSMALISKALQQARRPYIAFSGGKDSLAVVHLVHLVDPTVPLIWHDDELEYPETVSYLAQCQAAAGGQLIVTTGATVHAGWFEPWIDRPYWRTPLADTVSVGIPGSLWAADQGYDLTFTGLRMDENKRRRDHLVSAGSLYPASTGLRCCPIADWTADNVWHLIAKMALPYNPVYDRLANIGVPRHAQRVGPLPLARRQHLLDGWPDLLQRLEARYGNHWTS